MKTKIPPPVLMLLCGTVMWFVAHSTFAISFALHQALPIAIAVAALGFAIDLIALFQFRSAQTTVNPLQPEKASVLVSGGIFSKSRNPMYLGLMLVLTAWGLWLSSLSNIPVLLLFIVVITELQIKPEEVVLRSLFGDSYVEYCDRVRRWI